MGQFDHGAAQRDTERLRADYLAAYHGGELEAALRIGADELLPLAEALAETDPAVHAELATILRNLSLISHRLGLPIGAFHFIQRAFDSAMRVHDHGKPADRSLESAATETAELAAEIAGGHVGRGAGLSDREREAIEPAAALVPSSIELMGRLGSFEWACRLRVAATQLRGLETYPVLELVDHEARSIVWIARLAYAGGHREFAVAELREAIDLWPEQLGHGGRYWSTRLRRTLTVAAEVLESLGRHESARALRSAVELASENPRAVPDLRAHYREASAAMPR
ncbi:hypothetical protein GCM10027447_30070 [Glycomyces halotolerans]